MSTPKVSDHLSLVDFERLLEDAAFFAQRTQDVNFVEQCRRRFALSGINAGLTDQQLQMLKDIAGWVE
jgi:hypothetical protein